MNAPLEPLARVYGEPVAELPADLFIPPDALEVCLEAFEGPLDLLLWLIRRENINVLDIPMEELTRQYLAYIEALGARRFELAAEYLLMAAWLIAIKSRMLLPRPRALAEEPEEDPRAELVRRLLEYEQMKRAAENLDALPRAERDFTWVRLPPPERGAPPPPGVGAAELLAAWLAVLTRQSLHAHHHIRREELSVRDFMTRLLRALGDGHWHGFTGLLPAGCSRLEVVVSLLAMLELAREGLVELAQNEALAPIHLRLLPAVA